MKDAGGAQDGLDGVDDVFEFLMKNKKKIIKEAITKAKKTNDTTDTSGLALMILPNDKEAETCELLKQ